MMVARMLVVRDENWFRGIYAETYRPLLAFARRRVDPATADEVVAETFLTAWRRREEVPDGSERLWLFGVARNMIRNATRSSRRRELLHQRLRIVHPPEVVDPVTPSADSRVSMLRTALDSLREADREVLMLVAWEELSHAEIGEVLGISANASAIRVHRARKRLAAQLHRSDGATAGESNVRELPHSQQAPPDGQATAPAARHATGGTCSERN